MMGKSSIKKSDPIVGIRWQGIETRDNPVNVITRQGNQSRIKADMKPDEVT